MPLRTLVQDRYRSLVYQVRVVRLLPVPLPEVCRTRRVAVEHVLTMRGRVALAVFTVTCRTVSFSPWTVLSWAAGALSCRPCR